MPLLFKILGFVLGVVLVIALIAEGIDYFHPKNVKNFAATETVENFNFETLSEQNVNHTYINIVRDKDTNCRYVTLHGTQSQILPLDCNTTSDKPSGFSLLKKDDFFFVIKDNWSEQKFIVYKKSISPYLE